MFVRCDKKGFTLVEMIVATVILCGAVLALGATSSRCLSYVKLNRQYETAMLVADKQLAMIDYLGVESFIQLGRNEGVFKLPEAEFRWEVVTSEEEIDYLYLVEVTVSWIERRRTYSIVVNTKLNGIGSLVEMGEE